MPTFRLGGRTRKAVLVVHIAAAGTWLGVDVALGLLVLTVLGPGVPVDTLTAAASLAYFAPGALTIAGLACLATGVVLGVGSKYGLLRYWWVAVKLVLNVVLVTLVLAVLTPGLEAVASSARTALASGTPPALPDLSTLAFPPVVSTTSVLVAMTLSVVKPWGRRRPARSAPETAPTR